ncbi:EamA family transporter [Streptomyces sp. NPDC005263]|uniref:EamA family transporter n=1 Tax=Streptomyces sp. NPDC005263 TaxID=3364711 RepID=UPI003695ECAD
MIALLLALCSSLAYGCADFLGGLGARKAHVLRTVMIAAPASLVVELLLWPVLGASFSAGALGWGAASGVAGVLDSVANLLFLLAARSGDLAVVAVVVALYPVGTVVLARTVLAERIHRGRLVGLGTAAVAVSLLALT